MHYTIQQMTDNPVIQMISLWKVFNVTIAGRRENTPYLKEMQTELRAAKSSCCITLVFL